jgi:hypothetical protein
MMTKLPRFGTFEAYPCRFTDHQAWALVAIGGAGFTRARC